MQDNRTTNYRAWNVLNGSYSTEDSAATTDWFVLAQLTDQWGPNHAPTFKVLGHISSEDEGVNECENWGWWLQNHAIFLAQKQGLDPQHTVLIIVTNPAFGGNALLGSEKHVPGAFLYEYPA